MRQAAGPSAGCFHFWRGNRLRRCPPASLSKHNETKVEIWPTVHLSRDTFVGMVVRSGGNTFPISEAAAEWLRAAPQHQGDNHGSTRASPRHPGCRQDHLYGEGSHESAAAKTAKHAAPMASLTSSCPRPARHAPAPIPNSCSRPAGPPVLKARSGSLHSAARSSFPASRSMRRSTCMRRTANIAECAFQRQFAWP